MPGVKKHIVSDTAKRDLMSYSDHVKKAYLKGVCSSEQLKKSKRSKPRALSKYDV